MTTRTTNHLALDWRAHLRLWCIAHDRAVFAVTVLIVGTIVGLSLGWALYRSLPRESQTAAPTPGLPIILIATPAPPPPPTAAPVQQVAVLPNTLMRAVVAYDAPNGAVRGAIEAGRGYQLIERSGADWLHADVDGSGLVWLRSADVTGLPADLADVAPVPPPQIVYVASQPVEQPPAAAPPEAAPEEAAPTPESQQRIVMGVPLPPQLSERQANIQGHYVDPSVAQQLAAEAWRQEHTVGDQVIP